MARLAERLVAPVMDALTLLAAWMLLPVLAAQLAREEPANLVILLGAHLLMCFGVALAKWIAPAKTEDAKGGSSQIWLLGLSLPFSISLIAMLVITGGMLDETNAAGAFFAKAAESDEVTASIAVVLTFLFLISVFPTAVLLQPKKRVAAGSPAYWVIRLGSLLAVNTMVLVTAAFWEGYLADAESLGATIGLRILLTVVLFPVFLLFYAAPRLALLNLEPGRWSLAGFMIMLVLYIWHLTV